MTTRFPMLLTLVVGALSLTASPSSGEARRPVEIPERFRGAEQAVVGRVLKVEPTWRRFENGDELIVSRVQLAVEESLKGARVQTVTVDVEGGQIGDLILKVSDLPAMGVGERAVVLLQRDRSGRNVPHLRGQGIMKLDRSNMVAGTHVTLDDIRAMAREAGER